MSQQARNNPESCPRTPRQSDMAMEEYYKREMEKAFGLEEEGAEPEPLIEAIRQKQAANESLEYWEHLREMRQTE